MNALWQRRLHRCARASGWIAGVTLILLAVLAALSQLLLPLLAQHPAWVAAQLSQRLQRPVSLASIEGRRTASGPLFVMHGVTIGAAVGTSGTPLRIPEAQLKLDFGGWLLPSRHLLNLHMRGLQLDLLHDAGGWHVNGIGVAGGAGRQPLSLGPVSLGLWLEDLRVVVVDATLGKHYTLLSRQLRLSRQGDQIRFGGLLQREGVTTAVRTAGRFNQDGSAGQVWIGIDGAELKPLLDGIDMDGYTADHGSGKLNAWLDWRHGKLSRSLIRLDLDTLAVTAPTGGTASVAALHGLAGVRQAGDGYDIRWAGDDGSALALILHRPDSPQASMNVAARQLQLAPLLPWLALKPALAPALAQWLGSGHPHGELSRVALRWDRAAGLQTVDVAFADLGIDPVGKLPGVSGVSGELRGDAEALSLELPAQALTLQFPHAFRQPFVLSKLTGSLAFWPEDGDWHIGVDTLDFVGTGYAGQARGEVILPAQGGAPFMDMYATLDHADVPAAKLFWPLGSMSPGTIAWLDRALVTGNLDQAQVLVRGDMADWPFRHNEGRFEARAVLSGLTLDYGKDWPRAVDINAVASFVNNGMLVEASGGQSLGVTVGKAVALIPDFGDGLLDLNVQGSGSGSSLMEFSRKSPIAAHEADTLAKLKLGGNGTFNFHLALPLKDSAGLQLDGTAQLQDADLAAPDWNLKLDKLNGPLRFDAHGLQVGPLDAGFRGQPSRLQMAIAAANSDPATVLSAQLRGSYRMAELVQDYPSLNWLGQLADGRSDFDIGFTIAHVSGSDALAQTLSIDSPLSGIALDLPAPLNKPAATNLPLHLTMSLPVGGSDLHVALGEVMRGRLRLSDGPQRPLAATLAFGNQMPDTLPARDLRIRGHASQLDVTGWVQRAVAGSGGDGPGLESIDVGTDQAGWFGRPMGPLNLRAKPQPDVLSVDVEGAAMAGNFSVPTVDLDKRGVTARLQRLHWPKDPAPPASSHPGKAAADTGATAAVPAVDPANTGINPAALPPFHLWVGDLRLGDARLGDARLETWPTANGLHIEQLRALSSRVQINASGDWNGSASNSRTHMKISFAAEDLGAMMGAFGFDGLVNGGKTHDQLDASWPGGPSALSLATMDGTLSIHVSDGRIPEATSPGVGRLLGLVSLAELPRRLTLDFGDVFGKGLAFDSIAGDFHLADGNATTDNLLIAGSSANISITGRTGLRAHDYDQEMRVVPHVGNSLPLVGAVVGGPIGAAAGFAVQGLLGRGLNKAASARYRVTGTWDKPVMTLVEKHDVTVAPLLDRSVGLPAAAGSAALPPAGLLPAPSASASPPAPASSARQ
ncbi:TIGR02099 family protein [Rhodanobacter glycinis]|uniref:TIGR02099 family protein n=1 Tax=Rhodanobacter glycinis TaxID=582702 RepID=A0A502CCS1_9GAMM|nr:YhdP family protein [Rhodanobacter glycinis]TPG10482.1 TIGR02099 family protein [Rhodanobacter glycinis]TPG51311.1 TIGR02099 family protein [Rhodanobacter glycinis]